MQAYICNFKLNETYDYSYHIFVTVKCLQLVVTLFLNKIYIVFCSIKNMTKICNNLKANKVHMTCLFYSVPIRLLSTVSSFLGLLYPPLLVIVSSLVSILWLVVSIGWCWMMSITFGFLWGLLFQ